LSNTGAEEIMAKAIVVLSGGQDSTICLFLAKQVNYDEIHAITFDYAQRHLVEVKAAVTIARMAGVTSHEIISLGPVLKGRSPLTNPNEALETYSDFQSMDATIGDRVELTFVPMRNALFLTLAANRAACLSAEKIITGVCQSDNANYFDCRQIFIDSQEVTIHRAIEEKISIDTPLMNLTKAESIRLALTLPGCYTALGFSHTAYDGAFPPTGHDHASVLREHGFQEAGIADPLLLRACFNRQLAWPEDVRYEMPHRLFENMQREPVLDYLKAVERVLRNA